MECPTGRVASRAILIVPRPQKWRAKRLNIAEYQYACTCRSKKAIKDDMRRIPWGLYECSERHAQATFAPNKHLSQSTTWPRCVGDV